VTVQPFSSSKVRPGKSATYAIWVWSTGADSHGVAVTADVRHVAHVSAASFTVCPAASGTVCTVGDLPTGQADELLASVNVGRAAVPGTSITLTATAGGTRVASYHSAATMTIAAKPTSKSVTPNPTVTVTTQPPLPSGVTTLPGVGTSAQNPANLFPTVSPGASGTPSSTATGSASGHRHRINAVAASATLPLSPRLIGGQLAGLAVLAGAIAIAIARLSLRSPRPQGNKADE